MLMIDTHCHLDCQFYDNVEDVIDHMKDHFLIVSGTNMEDCKRVIDLCKQYQHVYGTIGFHPDEVDTLTEEAFSFLEKSLDNSKIIGIGEIGLDYFHNKENKDKQKELFIKQILLAKKYKKPIVIHSRDAIEDTYHILKEYLGDTKAVMHCYSGSLEMAKKFVQLGIKLGIGGVVTFKNAIKVREVVKEIPLSNLLLETDSPFLTPEPFRGKINEPFNVYYVAAKIAEIKNIKIEEVLEITSINAIFQFDLPVEI